VGRWCHTYALCRQVSIASLSGTANQRCSTLYKTSYISLIDSCPAYRTSLSTCSREYKHLGCFKDNQNDRILGNKMANETHTTADVRKPNNAAVTPATMKQLFGTPRLLLPLGALTVIPDAFSVWNQRAVSGCETARPVMTSKCPACAHSWRPQSNRIHHPHG